MNFIGLIPARYASTRFPGKPLALIGGKPMIQRVYEQAKTILDDVFVATDHERIYDAVINFGGKAVMTADTHRSGTDRCYEAYKKSGKTSDVIINIQGDEPFIHPSQIESLKKCFDDPVTEIATLAKPFSVQDGLSALENPNFPKVIINASNIALYFSRSVIPYLRDVPRQEWLTKNTFYKHIGLYAYKINVLEAITQLLPSPLEQAESLEQLRWIEAGYKIKVGITDIETIGVDTPEDLAAAETFLEKLNAKN